MRSVGDAGRAIGMLASLWWWHLNGDEREKKYAFGTAKCLSDWSVCPRAMRFHSNDVVLVCIIPDATSPSTHSHCTIAQINAQFIINADTILSFHSNRGTFTMGRCFQVSVRLRRIRLIHSLYSVRRRLGERFLFFDMRLTWWRHWHFLSSYFHSFFLFLPVSVALLCLISVGNAGAVLNAGDVVVVIVRVSVMRWCWGCMSINQCRRNWNAMP